MATWSMMNAPWHMQQLSDFAFDRFGSGGDWAGDWRQQAANAVNNYYLKQRAAGGRTRNLGESYAARLAGKGSRPKRPHPQQQRQPDMPDPNQWAQQQGWGGGGINVTPSITPQMPYSQGMTQRAVNQAVAGAHTQGNLPYLLNQASRGGMANTSPGVQARTVQPMAQALTGASQAQVQIPFSDQMANLNALLKGQTAREGEAQGLAGLGLQRQNMLMNDQLGNQLTLLSLLSSLA